MVIANQEKIEYTFASFNMFSTMSKFLKTYQCHIIPLVENKPIYYREDNPNIIVKAFTDLKQMHKERRIHLKARSIVPCPKIINSVYEDQIGYLVMERIKGETVHNKYGLEYNIPSSVWVQIHSIVSILFSNDIHYIDITPHNFMIEENTGKVYVIDFGNACVKKVNWFLKEFLDGENSWNRDFE